MRADSMRYVATAAAQLLMSREVPINADGKWGRFTQSAYSRISDGLRAQVDDLVKRIAGVTPADLALAREEQRATAKSAKIDTSDMRALVARVAREEGVPEQTALKIVNLESRFNPNAVSPTGAKGLMQLTPIAVQDIAQRAGHVLAREDVLDPEKNARAGMKYIKLVARDLGVRLDQVDVVYMGFNIGPTGAKHVLRGQPERAEAQIRLQSYGKRGVNNYASSLREAVALA